MSEKYTETLHHDKYQNGGLRKSKFVKGLVIDDPRSARTVCPRCRTEMKLLRHGESETCRNCNLHMQVFGNGLTISEGAA